MKLALRFALLLGVLGCEAKQEQPHSAAAARETVRSATCGEEIVSDEGIGKLRIAETVDSVRANCIVIRDTTEIAEEGMPARNISVAFARDTVGAEIVNGRVWRIAIGSPRFQTFDSIGVGTALTRLLRLKNPRGLTGEGELFLVSPDHCGLSFRLSSSGSPASREWNRAALARLPASTSLAEILIVGCGAKGRSE